jgi:hypothetical protein
MSSKVLVFSGKSYYSLHPVSQRWWVMENFWFDFYILQGAAKIVKHFEILIACDSSRRCRYVWV